MTASGPGPFRTILCAVDGSRASMDAARQAVALAGPHTTITFLAVTWRVGTGLGEMASLGPRRAERALEQAAAHAYELDVRCSKTLVQAPSSVEAILAAAADHDLLAAGAPAHPRHAGILIGSTATELAHRAPGALLLARRPPQDVPFPDQMIVATDGSRTSLAAVELAAAIAAASGTRLTLVHLAASETRAAHGLMEHTELVQRRLGSEPPVRMRRGIPHRALAEIAREQHATLLVLGSRGLFGPRALGSVSERAAHAAPCSVLIARPRVRAGDRSGDHAANGQVLA